MTRILVTGGDHAAGLAAARALAQAGHQTWVSYTAAGAYASRSRVAVGKIPVPDPREDPEGFVAELASARDRYGLEAVLFGTERDMLAAARRADVLAGLAGIPDLASVIRVTSKPEVYRLASAVGLRVPDTAPLQEWLAEGPAAPTSPFVLKPARSELVNGDGVLRHCDCRMAIDTEELRSAARELEGQEWLVQACVSGRLGAISGVAWHGRSVATMHQISDRIWPPALGVSAYARTIARNSGLEAGVVRLVRELGWSGIFQAQFIHSAAGSHLIDFNPRPYGSLALACAAGLNLPAIWIALLLGLSMPELTYRVGARFRSEELDALALLHLARIGRRRQALIGLLPRRGTAHALVTLDDPFPALTSLNKLRHGRTGSRVAQA